MSVRRVKAGLGGHDAGVSGVDDGVENTSFPISKRGRLALPECPAFSGFWCLEGEKVGVKQNCMNETV